MVKFPFFSFCNLNIIWLSFELYTVIQLNNAHEIYCA